MKKIILIAIIFLVILIIGCVTIKLIKVDDEKTEKVTVFVNNKRKKVDEPKLIAVIEGVLREGCLSVNRIMGEAEAKKYKKKGIYIVIEYKEGKMLDVGTGIPKKDDDITQQKVYKIYCLIGKEGGWLSVYGKDNRAFSLRHIIFKKDMEEIFDLLQEDRERFYEKVS